VSRPIRIRSADCSYEELVRAARKSGFVIKGGRKHCKIEDKNGKFITVIPRKNRLKRETAKGVVEAFNKFGANIILS
jgi:hypothetical protein